MTTHDKQLHEDDEGDSDIRALMHESDYSGRLRDDFKRELLRELNHNFKYHPMHSRILLVAAAVLVVGVAMWRVTDVGSDGFTLRPNGRKVGADPIVEAPMTGDRFNAPAVDGSTAEGVTAAQQLYEQISAHDAKVVRLEIWVIGGESVQSVLLEVNRDGVPTQVMHGDRGSSRFSRQWRAFKSGPGRVALDAIERHDSVPQAIESARFFDQDFTVGVWIWETPDFGPVVYKRSMP
jgi:hypothetical protein